MTKTDKNRNNELLQILHGLIRDWEHEIVEFKQANNNFKQNEVGEYFSAISNEANLQGLQHGWLVFGVHNKTKEIVHTNYREKGGLEKLKHEIADNTTGRMTFLDIFEVYSGEDRIVMFKIPAAIAGMPTAWKGHYYGREGESLGPLSMEELDRIRGQVQRDWSKQIVDGLSMKHLDNDAIYAAREGYKEKHNDEYISTESDKMSDEEFLTKLNLMVNGKLTNAAMVLFGNPDYDYLLDVPVSAMWRLHSSNDRLKDYVEFRMPFVLVANKIYGKIRNSTYRYMPDQSKLDTMVTQQYNEELLKELIYNCIAHMDYMQGGRIYIDELEDSVIISNPGSFIPGDVRKVLKTGYTAPYYRNLLLASAMANISLIDSAQWGIRKVFDTQRDRYFPLPDYDFSTPNKVAVTVYGKVLDQNYTRLLFSRSDLELDTVFLLDRVQKKLPLEKEQYQTLRKLGVIEGKAPNVYISLEVAKIVDDRAQYTKNKAMDDRYYMDLIINYLQQFGSGTKADFIILLNDKLSDVLDDKQKAHKVRNLLMSMSRNGQITHGGGNQRTGSWELAKTDKV